VDPLSIRALRDLIDRHETFFHVTHVNPDADGLGSALAMHRWLRSQGKRSELLVPSDVPRKIAFLARDGEARIVQGEPGSLPDDGVFMLYDVSTLSRLGALEAAVRRSKQPVVVFDHHDGEVEFDALALVEESAGATAQVIADVLESWGVTLTEEIALPLYVAIVADTGSFNYGKTTPHTHAVAGRLLDAGVDPLEVHGQLTGNRSLAAMHAGGAVLQGLRVDEREPRVAHATMTLAQYCSGGSDALEMLDLVNQTIALEGVRAGVLFIEAEPSVTRLSMRSRGVTSIVEVAKALGGGGHRNAAGVTIAEPVAAVRERVLAALREAVKAQHG
jgi:phosphoesterase RecJ-like protein